MKYENKFPGSSFKNNINLEMMYMHEYNYTKFLVIKWD